jgi:adenine/guanine phosphoribosyltransferase-like PRPP-binding protein
MQAAYPSAESIVLALRLIQGDFDGRPTHQVMGRGGRIFEFFPTSITDNIPPLHPNVSHAICLLSQLHLEHQHEATLGVGEEDRGAMIISDVLLSLNLPRTLARWTPTGAPGEVQVPLSNEYIQEGDTRIFLNGVRAHDRVIIVDDLISTGGTLVALIEAVRITGATILEILTIGEKSENGGREFLKAKTGLSIKTMLSTSLETRDGKCYSKLIRFHLGKLPTPLLKEVASAFPPGFCVPGSGE